MRWHRKKEPPREQPAPEEAQRQLDRLREQWGDVDALRHGYRTEFLRNHFGDNIEKIFAGRKP